MFNNPEIIHVFIEDQKVGRLGLGKDFRAVFEYDNAFIRQGFSISPFHLPLRTGIFIAKQDPFDGLFGVFSDSLPDSWGNLLLERYLKSKGLDVNTINLLGRLSMVGNSGMGCLSYRPQFQSSKTTNSRLVEEYAIEVANILKEKEYPENMDDLYHHGAASGGARPKILIQIDGEPWIIKFPSPFDADDFGAIEYNYALIAKNCGIQLPETRLFKEKYFGVKRFDFSKGKRIHMHSVAGLLYANYRYPSLDYHDLMATCMALTKNMEEVAKLYRQMVFNVLTGNKDDHARNFSFLYNENRWILSPAYDLTPNIGFNGQHTTTINGKGNPSRDDINAIANRANIPKKTADKIFTEVYENSKSLQKTTNKKTAMRGER